MTMNEWMLIISWVGVFALGLAIGFNSKQFRVLLAALLNSHGDSQQTMDEAFIEADIWIEAGKKKKPKEKEMDDE